MYMYDRLSLSMNLIHKLNIRFNYILNSYDHI